MIRKSAESILGLWSKVAVFKAAVLYWLQESILQEGTRENISLDAHTRFEKSSVLIRRGSWSTISNIKETLVIAMIKLWSILWSESMLFPRAKVWRGRNRHRKATAVFMGLSIDGKTWKLQSHILYQWIELRLLWDKI